MAHAAQVSSMFDVSPPVLRTTATTRLDKMGDAKRKRYDAQGKLALVGAHLSTSTLASPVSSVRSSTIALTPITNTVSATPVLASTFNLDCANAADVSHVIRVSQSEGQSVEQYIWSACWFLMGFLFLCAT